MEKEIYKVKPIIIYPKCIEETGKQDDCHTCQNKEECLSPRSMCVRPYKNNPEGCPKFGKIPTCPPNIPCMFDQIFDMDDVYAVVTKFDLASYFQSRRERRPDLAEGQIRNLRAWQPKAIKENDLAIKDFYEEYPSKKNYIATRLLECMGVDVIGTMREVGVNITFPVKDYAYRVAFLARVYEEMLEKYGFQIHEETSKEKKGIKRLVLKKD